MDGLMILVVLEAIALIIFGISHNSRTAFLASNMANIANSMSKMCDKIMELEKEIDAVRNSRIK